MKNKIQRGFEQASELGKKVAVDTKDNVHTIIGKIQDENTKALLKKYNPVFPDEFFAEGFSIPNMIVIVDDASRKSIEVCKGAIGWINVEKDMEVLYLYDEAVKDSGLQFIPVASCDSVFYVDGFDRTKYVKLDNYYENMQTSKLAELEHIAFSLGAKSYLVELEESLKMEASIGFKAFEKLELPIGASKKGTSSSYESGVDSKEAVSNRVLKQATFTNGAEPVQPKLKWFKHDAAINNLIDMRLSGKIIDNSMQEYSIKIEGSAYSCMGARTAAKIDAAVGKLGAGTGYNMSKQEKKESKKSLIYKIVF